MPARAQFPINEPFTGSTSSAFTLGGNAALTGTNTTPGYLRLTAATNNQAGYAILNSSFASSQGFSISFEFFSYGGSAVAADGISVFLLDANGTDPKVTGQFSIGAYGGSLGYAQKTAAGGGGADINGVSKGYLGIGLDEYGNYATSSEGRSGGYTTTGTTSNTTTLVPQSVTLRGAGSGTTGYPYLTSSGQLPFNLSVGTARAQPGSADYRKAYINLVPVNGSYQVTIRIQYGASLLTTTSSFTVATPPTNLRIGFGGSTGGLTNIHEIRNLAVLNNPYAADDNALTKYGTPVTINVLGNDRGLGAAINPASVDLDPFTAGIQNTYTVAGKGTFTVNSQGVVTFTPAAGFAGLVAIPYAVSDIVNQVSNPAIITVGVTGADVATGLSGPATANPGSQVTYTVATTNNGAETATNVTPTLQLPTGLSVAASPNYTYNSSSGLVTFSPATLGAGQAASNAVTFTVPTSGVTSVTGVAGYTYPTGAAVPDAVSTNNTASLTTTVTGAANVATSCSVPGKDGPATLDNTTQPNTYYPGVAVTATGGTSVITVGAAAGNPTPVAAGDLVLVMQMQGATTTTEATSSSYGQVSALTAGQYEYATVASVSGLPVASITLAGPLSNTYTTGTNQNFQVVRVPQYSALTVSGTVTGLAWSSTGKVGGVLALDVAGTTTFGSGAGLSMSAKGFAGGGGVNYGGPAPTGTTTANFATAASGAHGSKGEGIAGTPKNFYDGTAVRTTGAGYPTGDNNRGAPATAGGGAQDFTPASNTGNSGGGGGANVAAGGSGGYGRGSGSTGNQAAGGYAVAGAPTRLLLGGGGGAGSSNSATAQNSSGGVGGGIIILRTGTTSGSGTLQANGGTATTAGGTQGGGGGGAGGTILVLATPTPSTTTTGLASLTASATGAAGSNVNNGLLNTGALTASYGPGGGGSGGAIYSSGALSTATVAGGAAGSTSNGVAGNTPFGATAGAAGTSSSTTTAAGTNTTGGASACLPMLSVALSTSTPNVTRAGNGTPGPATFTVVISNTGGQAQSTSTTLAMSPLFSFDNTFTPVVTLTTASGTVSTLPASAYTVAGTSSPVFSGLSIPSGATLRITYRAAIAPSAVNSTPYQASGTVAFADPTRTAAATTTSPGATFVGGGTVPGTNYAAASSTLEDVTIVAPLPVELVRFEATAVRQSVLLSWATATELHNDHFVVERSRTGSSFVAIGTVRGKGSSTTLSNYSFLDHEAGELAAGSVLYYRLRQVDTDGTESFGPVRAVRLAAASTGTASLYPNPSPGQLTLDLSSLPAGTYSVQVLDLAGRQLRQQSASAQLLPLHLTDLAPGAYLVLVQGEGLRQTLPLLRE